MLAARRLFPGAVVALAGSLNRNVREFFRLHADDLEDVVEASRLEPAAIRKLIVVETTSAGRLGELEPVARDPDVEKVVFDHHERLPEWAEAVFGKANPQAAERLRGNRHHGAIGLGKDNLVALIEFS